MNTQDTKEIFSCTCNGFRQIVQSAKSETCSHRLAVAMSVAKAHSLSPIEILTSDALQPPLAVGIADRDATTRNQAYAEAAGLKFRPALV